MQDDFDQQQWLHDNEQEIKALKIEKVARVHEFVREQNKLDQEWARKPWWVKQQEEGDYHYGRYDVDWEERDDK